MSNLECFFAQNIEGVEEIDYVASTRIKDENKQPVKWRLRVVPTDEVEKMRKKCTKHVGGKRGAVTEQLDTNMLNDALVCACVVFPDLQNASLQDSYGVKTESALLHKILSVPGEYFGLLQKVNEINAFDFDETVEEVKN